MPVPLQLITSLVIIVPVIVFWLWMFRDMLTNPDLPRNTKDNWTLAFIFLNAVAAMFYYVNIYRNRY